MEGDTAGRRPGRLLASVLLLLLLLLALPLPFFLSSSLLSAPPPLPLVLLVRCIIADFQIRKLAIHYEGRGRGR